MHIPFAVSERSTIGIEWELALVDSDSGDLRQVAMTVLDAVRPDDAPEHPSIKQELLLNTVEVVSSVGRNAREAGADLQRAIDEIRAVTDPRASIENVRPVPPKLQNLVSVKPA